MAEIQKKVGLGGLGKASNAIKNIQKKAVVLVEVPLELIDFDDEQYRQDKDRYDLVKLATSIRNRGGLIQNPNYEKKTDGRYLVLTGEMRTRAYMYLKENFPEEPQWNSIEVRLRELKPIEGLSLKASRKLFQFAENDDGEKPNLFDRAKGLLDIFEEGGNAAVQIALSNKDLKSSPAEISKWKSIAKVNPDIRGDILDGEIEDKETIITLGKISEKKPAEYEKLINSFKDKTLGLSLAKASKASWDSIKQSEGKKVSKAKGKSKSQDSASNNKKNVETSIQEIVASDVNFKNGSLVIKTQNGTEMKFVGLDNFSIEILKNSKR